jgi:predicted dehydrogenase
MNKIKLGLIGLGSVGKVHLGNCLKMAQAELLAVSDVSKRGLNFAKKMGVKKTFSDYRELLNQKDLDAVIIALPTHLHAACAKEAAEAGKDIFLEKPLARNVSEGREITSSIQKHGVRLMIGYPFRFSPPFQALKARILSGELGEVQIAIATNISAGPFSHRTENSIPRPVPEWWFKKELTGGGVLLDLGSHMINLTRWYLGKVSSVESYLGHRFNLEQEDHAICMLKFEHGQIAIINVGWFSQDWQTKVELFGTVGHAIAAKFEKGYTNEIQYFVHCIKDDLQPMTSGDDALKDLEIITQAYEHQLRSRVATNTYLHRLEE